MKQINDTDGHAAGDAALGWVARVPAESVRGSDVLGRLGGDEFGVILGQSEILQGDEKAESLDAKTAAAPSNGRGSSSPYKCSAAPMPWPATEATPIPCTNRPTKQCTSANLPLAAVSVSSRWRPAFHRAYLPPPQAIMFGTIWLSSFLISSLSMSLRFFRRWICN